MKDLCLRWIAIKEEMESNPDVASRDAFSYLVELQPLIEAAVKAEQQKEKEAVKKQEKKVVEKKAAPVVEKKVSKKK